MTAKEENALTPETDMTVKEALDAYGAALGMDGEAHGPPMNLSFEEAMALFDNEDEVAETFTLDGGKLFRCKIKRIRSMSEWQNFITQMQQRGRVAGKGGLPVTLPDGTPIKITSDEVAASLSVCEHGVSEPNWTFPQWAAFGQRSGPLVLLIAQKVTALNNFESVELAKNDLEQAPGTETPELPA